LSWDELTKYLRSISWRITNQKPEEKFSKIKISKKNFKRERFKRVKLRKTREKNLSHVFILILIFINFQFFVLLFIQNSVIIPNLSPHFFEDELHKLRIPTTFKSLSSFLFSLSNGYWKKFDMTNLLFHHFCDDISFRKIFHKDKGNLFYVSITFWMMIMCKKNCMNIEKSPLSFSKTLVKMNLISNFLNGCSIR
jgi:hypothetical protein